jgi:hypothetical protein
MNGGVGDEQCGADAEAQLLEHDPAAPPPPFRLERAERRTGDDDQCGAGDECAAVESDTRR